MHDRVALVTGGASGIGRAAAIGLARAGARVLVGDLDVEGADETAELVAGEGGEALAVRLDVTSEEDAVAAARLALERFGRLDWACNAAGIQGPLRSAGDYGEADWASVIGVNLSGVWRCMKHELAAMVAGGGGAIVNVSSNFGLVGAPGMPAYCASKHGVIGLTKSAALDYARRGVRVNAVCPGPTDTPMIGKVLAENPQVGAGLVDSVVEQLPMARLGTAEEVAQAVVWLCSDAAGFVTGAVLSVDGGYVVR